MKRTSFISAILTLVFFISGAAQTHKVNSQKSSLTVEGTSSLHDWEIDCEKVGGEATLVVSDGVVKNISTLKFSVEVEKMESGKSLMNSKTYDALKKDTYPTIQFELVKVVSITPAKAGVSSISAEGKLTIAGKTKTVVLDVSADVSEDVIAFSGEYKLDMTSFDVTPPTALMGTIKTGKDVVVKYHIFYNHFKTIKP